MQRPTRLVRLEARSSASLAERTDDELMTLAQAGLRPAFAVLVERHAARVVQLCSRFVGDADVGAELAQETWVAVWQHRARYRPDGKFVVWLITAGRNRCRNHLRNHRVAQRHAATAAADAPTPDQIDALLSGERARRVREALARLPEAMREALILRFAEDLRYDEMVAIMRVGGSTLRSRVHHGLRLLREMLGKSR
ncbi:MAG TPA: sigma-70 family RNA polymerase sigma factor [Polyangiaceae bacterium]|nr:sigma-70 family RNA polymerase sigma factor [Polyangiaceae bacterium]